MKAKPFASRLLPALALATLVAAAPSAFAAKDKGKDKSADGPGKILLFIDLETVDSRADNRYQPKPMPMMGETALPYSQADLASAPADKAAMMIEANDREKARLFSAKTAIVWERYQEQVSHQKDMIAKYQGTQTGRHLFVARDWFASALMEDYAEFITVIHRMDSDKAEFEKAIKDDTSEVVAGEYLAIVVLDDPITKTTEMDFPGATTVSRTICTLRATAEVQTLDGRVVYSKNVEGKATGRESNASRSSGSDDLVGKAIEDALGKAGKAVAGHFVCDVTVEVKGPKGDEDFDPDEVDVEIDGQSVSDGDDVTVLRDVPHEITASCDGYRQKGKTRFTANKDKTVKVVMEKASDDDGGDGDED